MLWLGWVLRLELWVFCRGEGGVVGVRFGGGRRRVGKRERAVGLSVLGRDGYVYKMGD